MHWTQGVVFVHKLTQHQGATNASRKQVLSVGDDWLQGQTEGAEANFQLFMGSAIPLTDHLFKIFQQCWAECSDRRLAPTIRSSLHSIEPSSFTIQTGCTAFAASSLHHKVLSTVYGADIHSRRQGKYYEVCSYKSQTPSPKRNPRLTRFQRVQGNTELPDEVTADGVRIQNNKAHHGHVRIADPEAEWFVPNRTETCNDEGKHSTRKKSLKRQAIPTQSKSYSTRFWLRAHFWTICHSAWTKFIDDGTLILQNLIHSTESRWHWKNEYNDCFFSPLFSTGRVLWLVLSQSKPSSSIVT